MARTREGSGLMSSALLAGSLFAILTAPLAVLGSQPIDIEARGQTLFSGKLEDVASNYLGIAVVASLGVGTLGGQLLRKRGNGAQKKLTDFPPLDPAALDASGTRVESQIFDLDIQTLSTAAAHSLPSHSLPSHSPQKAGVAELLSPLSLRATGLDFFLDDGEAEPQPNPPELLPTLSHSSSHSPSNFESKATLQALPMTQPAPQPIPRPVAVNPAMAVSVAPSLAVEPAALGQSAGLASPLTLEGWTEAFLSDSPLVPLAQPAARQQLTPLSRYGSALPAASSPEVLSPVIVAAASAASAGSVAAPTQSLRLARPLMPAAQTYLSFTHFSSTAALYAPEQSRNLQMEMEALEKLEQVREQIQVLSAQMELIQNSLSLQDYSAQRLVALPSTPPKPTYVVGTAETAYESEPGAPAHRVYSQVA